MFWERPQRQIINIWGLKQDKRKAMHAYSLKEGSHLVAAARNAIELFLIDPEFDRMIVSKTIEHFERPHGVFVSLEHYPTREPRGLMGFPKAISPLGEMVVESAIAAAFEDQRFVPISKNEMDHLVIGISILSEPVKATGGKARRLSSIKLGRDGIIVQYGLYMGILLPQVAVEHGWGKERFLDEACRRAGLHSGYWTQPNVKLYRFEAQTFAEQEPNGRVIEAEYKS